MIPSFDRAGKVIFSACPAGQTACPSINAMISIFPESD
jgi:hypothetical protein